MSITVVIVVPAVSHPGVRYTSVKAKPSRSDVGGYELVVSMELETTGAMPNVAPYVVVTAQCDTAGETETDDEQAFFMMMSNAPKGAKFADSSHLFFVSTLSRSPKQCEITLALSEVGGVEKYCFEDGKTTAGACRT
ncbi:MAG: hypothetical protein U0271_44825 [Polyangiaceae bacterium]